MRNLYDILNWMQNGKIQLLILSMGNEDISSHLQKNLSHKIQKFFFFDYRDNSISPMCLYEIWLGNDIENIEDEIEILIKNIPSNIDLCLIFDGYLINLSDLFDTEAHKYIYAIKFQNELQTAYTELLRNSKSWLKRVTAMLNFSRHE
ncbi:MAG: hypothetical protein HWE34_13900 [Methylocystaceae bacterium]|nr:hypothetical protein [Methylocystaceae bacterium]